MIGLAAEVERLVGRKKRARRVLHLALGARDRINQRIRQAEQDFERISVELHETRGRLHARDFAPSVQRDSDAFFAELARVQRHLDGADS